MRVTRPFPILSALSGLLVAAGPFVVAQVPGKSTESAKGAAEAVEIIRKNCLSCHSGEHPKGGLSLTDRARLLKGSVTGPVVDLKSPAESKLLKAINYLGPQMPPTGRLPQKEIDTVTKWVKLGAPWPEKAKVSQPAAHGPPKVTPEAMNFWSFRALKRPAIPKVKHSSWVRNPIDTFVLSKLEKEGLAPNPPADPTALIRRAHYDLIGLPPTPEEVKSYLSNWSYSTYFRMIDKLLASPQYGEKWGRHWLDLVRYAETDSYERDGAKPNVWRYRDYVIKSFNDDKPYDQFVTEQLAGDEMGERTPERIIATGYYRLGLWDDEPADPAQALYDDLDDILSTTGQVMLGLTIGCARCHDHKIDPMPQKDYYRMLAFFRGVRRYGVRSAETVAAASLRSIASPEDEARYAKEIAEHRDKLKAVQDPITEIENLVRPDLTPVEKEEFQDLFKRDPIVKKRVPKVLTQDQYDKYANLREERRRLMRNPPRGLEMALCVSEVGREAPDTHVLMRGNPHSPADKVSCGFPSVLGSPDPEVAPAPNGQTPGRRLALAKWLTGSENRLTARVLANRIWQYHFGRGIVRTPNDFGYQGARPTHPDLLNWLAAELVNPTDDGRPMTDRSAVLTQHVSRSTHQNPSPVTRHPSKAWSLKRLHKLIMLSNTYRMSSRANKLALQKDPANDLFWRFDMRRLGAEEVRDTILAANGSLNLQQGGPSIYAEIPQAVLAGQSMPGAGWGKSPPDQERRRSVYIHVKRSLITPIIASFDGPETDFTCPVRFATTQPTQALGMMNSEWVNKQARVFAEFVNKNAGPNPQDQVKFALWRVLQRDPTSKEVDRGVKRIEALQRDDRVNPDESLRLFCLIALNLNEFIYLD